MTQQMAVPCKATSKHVLAAVQVSSNMNTYVGVARSMLTPFGALHMVRASLEYGQHLLMQLAASFWP